MLSLSATRSHFYPGARGRVRLGAPIDGPAEVEFADGSRAAGRLSGRVLDLAAYVTAAGTAIPAQSWTVTFDGVDFRVSGRA